MIKDCFAVFRKNLHIADYTVNVRPILELFDKRVEIAENFFERQFAKAERQAVQHNFFVITAAETTQKFFRVSAARKLFRKTFQRGHSYAERFELCVYYLVVKLLVVRVSKRNKPLAYFLFSHYPAQKNARTLHHTQKNVRTLHHT